MAQQTSEARLGELIESISTPLKTRRLYHAGVIFLVGLFLLIVVAVVGAFHDQPLRYINNGIVSSRVQGSNGVIAARTQKNNLTTWLEPKGAFTVTVVVSMYNVGSLPVTIERLSGPSSIRRLSDRVYFEPSVFGTNSEGFNVGARFFPFTVPGHSELTLIDRWTEQCVPWSRRPHYRTINALPTSTRILEIHHMVMMPIHPFRIELAKAC